MVWECVTQETCALWKAFEGLEVRVHDVRFPLSGRGWDDAEYTEAYADLRLEVINSLNSREVWAAWAGERRN